MYTTLVISAILGVATTAVAFVANRRLFAGGGSGRVTLLEGLYYLVGLCSLGLGWYFNVRYTHLYGHERLRRTTRRRSSPTGRRTRRPRTTSS